MSDGGIEAASRRWDEHGFAILPALLSSTDLEPAIAELPQLYPTAAEFHDDPYSERNARFRDEFGGIDEFPFAGVELNLLCAHPRLLDLATRLLRTDELRLYSAEAWAKYTGAADYEQHLHRDYLNHTMLVPSDDARFRQLELFVFLSDVTDAHGTPRYVSRQVTGDAPAWPNWLAPADRPELYADEVTAAGPAGTVVAWELGTFHRGSQLTASRGARYTLHVSYRPAAADWAVRYGWAHRSHTPEWYRFVPRATPRQLAMFGFPPPGHPYWTTQTIAGVAERYPGLDTSPWQPATGDTRPDERIRNR